MNTPKSFTRFPKEHAATIALVLLPIVVPLVLFGCKKEPPTDTIDDSYVNLAAVDVSCNEIWLRVFLHKVTLPATLELRRDENQLLSIPLNAADTTLLDRALLPGRDYHYQITVRGAGMGAAVLSPPVLLRTMDTVSHSYQWSMETLGEPSASSLYDVAILNDTLAYAVGEIYLKDALGQPDPNAYNLIRWDGRKWTLKRISLVGPCCAVLYPALRAIWAIAPNEILFTDGGAIARFDGLSATLDCGMNNLLDGAINRIYASSAADIYAVGNSGAVVHYSQGSWHKIQTGTTLHFYDVYGASDPQSGEHEVLAVCSQNYPSGRAIYDLAATPARELSTVPIGWDLFSVWFVPRHHYYLVGSGIYEKHLLEDPSWKNNPRDITRYGTSKIRGTALNDIMVVGAFGECLHWNGNSWRSYLSETGLANGSYASVAMKGNLVMAVGYNAGRAVILSGRR